MTEDGSNRRCDREGKLNVLPETQQGGRLYMKRIELRNHVLKGRQAD